MLLFVASDSRDRHRSDRRAGGARAHPSRPKDNNSGAVRDSHPLPVDPVLTLIVGEFPEISRGWHRDGAESAPGRPEENTVTPERIDAERAVRERYSAAAGERIDALCCPVDYDPRYLEAIPAEIIERDYGCGDPSKHLRPGEVVLDLGSGGGKICFIAAQVVGPDGRVIGVDVNAEMLALSESYRAQVAERIGYSNVTFVKGRIQDLALDLAALDASLAEHPPTCTAELDLLQTRIAEQRRSAPLIPDASVDVVVSNCVLNLVASADKSLLFDQIYRVLRRGGRAVISDIVCDEDVPAELQADPELWSGCISGAFREDALLEAFERAGFHGIRLLGRDEKPWRVVDGIEFRSVTVEAFKGKEGPGLERNQAVIYRGPWRSVTDDDGHTLYRGRRMAVSDKTFGIYAREPYAGEIIALPPREGVADDAAAAFDRSRDAVRSPRETKGADYRANRKTDPNCCGPGDSCSGPPA